MDTPISSFPRGDLRVSDAERDRAVAELSEHYQTGRLTAEEFEDRSGRALQARTGNELSNLFTDLPKGAAPAVAAAGGAVSMPGRRPMSAARIAFLCVIAAIVIGNVLGSLGHDGFGLLIPVFVLAAVFRFRGIRR